MNKSRSTNNPKKTRSILSKLFGKTSSRKQKEQKSSPHLPIADHDTQCDENGNSKSKLANKSKNVDKPKKSNRNGRKRLFFFRRKKDESDIDIPGTPIYVELSPTKSAFIPDLISDEIYRHNKSPSTVTSHSSRSSFSPENKEEHRSGQSSQKQGLISTSNNVQSSNSNSGENCYDTISVDQKQTNHGGNNSVRGVALDINRLDAKRTRSFNSKDFKGSLRFRPKISESDATEDDVGLPPSVYAGMCRKSNRMLQTVQESGSKRRLDRSFLRWNSVADLQYQTSKEKCKVISKLSKVTNNEKSISLQDLSTKSKRNIATTEKPNITPLTSFCEQDTTDKSVKITKIRPSLDKALSKSEYDLRNVHTSPRSRGILAFKKVHLPNTSIRRSGRRPVSAILPSTLSIIGEKKLGEHEAPFCLSAKTSMPTRNTAIVKPTYHSAEAEYVDINPVQSIVPGYNVSISDLRITNHNMKNGNKSIGRTHSFQDRYSPPLYRRAYQNNATRPKSCIEQHATTYPPLPRANEQSPFQNTSRRGGTVSRSRSRARSIAKRFNISGSTENISPSKFSVCRSNNWKSTDLDANDEYCAMKPILMDSSVIPSDARSVSVGYSDIPFHYSNVTGHNHIDRRYGYMGAPSYHDRVGPYPEPIDPNVRRRKLFYALDV